MEMATSTPFFTEALNEILADGSRSSPDLRRGRPLYFRACAVRPPRGRRAVSVPELNEGPCPT